MKNRTLTICGHEVEICYCAATETGFEDLSMKPIYELNFKSQKDLLTLCTCAIVSAYAPKGEQPPISSSTLLYEATPQEIVQLTTAVIELRAEWYGIPKVIEDDIKRENEEAEANGEEPTKN